MIIVVVPGTTGETFAWLRGKEVGLPGSVFRQYPGENELLLALKSGEIDAIARGEIGNRYRQGLNHSVLTIDLRDFGEDFAMSIDPTNVDLQKHLAEALKLATKDGALDFRQWSDNPSIFSDWYVANTTGGYRNHFCQGYVWTVHSMLRNMPTGFLTLENTTCAKRSYTSVSLRLKKSEEPFPNDSPRQAS